MKNINLLILNITILITVCCNETYAQITPAWNKVYTNTSSIDFIRPLRRYGTTGGLISLSQDKSRIGIAANSGTIPYFACINTDNGDQLYQNLQSGVSGYGGGVGFDSKNNFFVLSRDANNTANSYLRKFSPAGLMTNSTIIKNHIAEWLYKLYLYKNDQISLFGSSRPVSTGYMYHSSYKFSNDLSSLWKSTINELDWFYGYYQPNAMDINDNIIMVGKRQSNQSDPQTYDAVIRKVDSTGTQKWQIFLNQQGRQDLVTDVVTDQNGDIYLSMDHGGTSRLPYYLVKLNGATGGIIWNKTMNLKNSPNLAVNGTKYLMVLEPGGSVPSSSLLYAIDLSTGNIAWTTSGLTNPIPQLVCDNKGLTYMVPEYEGDSLRVVDLNGKNVYATRILIPNFQVNTTAIEIDTTYNNLYISGYAVAGTNRQLFLSKYKLSSTCDIPSYNPFPATVLSSEDSLKLDAGTGFTNYRWSTNDTTQSIHVKYTGGYKVTVTNASGCTASDSVFVQFPDTVGLHVSTVSGVCNLQVDVPVRATSFRHMLTMQGSVNWNAADLRLDSISGYGPASLGMNVGNFGTAQSSNGKLTFSWNDQSGNGLSLADSTTIFTLRFTILGTSIRSIPVVISGSPTSIEFYDATLTKKTTSLTPGAVNVTCEFLISGRVLTPTDKGVKNVTVTLSGGSSAQTATTDSAGNYTFKVLPGTYTLTPSKSFEQYKTNGVSTLDIALIQAHLLQKTPFNAAYKVIASDANNNSGISTADILSIRRLILNTDTSFPNNRNWAFVDGEQTFANPLTPFPFNATKTYTNLSTDIAHTFRGIKIGDVNYDRNPLLDQAPSGDTLRLFGEWTDTEDGYATLRVKSHAVSGLLGWQSTLRWDVSQLKLQSVNGLVSNLGLGERWKDEGYLTMSWNDPRAEGLSFTEGSTWMELRFLKTRNLKQASIGITEQKLGTEAFNGNYQSMGVKMESTVLRGNAWEGMLRVYPNPVGSMVNVEWKMEKAGAATIRLLDAQGRVVHMERGDYAEGVQRISIRRLSGWSVAGTWMVQVESEGVVRNVPVVMAGE